MGKDDQGGWYQGELAFTGWEERKDPIVLNCRHDPLSQPRELTPERAMQWDGSVEK
jgi:hypothetical protein